MTYKCQKCNHYKVDYEFSTEYMSMVAVEECLLKKPLFNEECIDFKEGDVE
jgi:hypothetical protein